MLSIKDSQRLLKLLGTIGIVAVRNGNIKLNNMERVILMKLCTLPAVKVQTEQKQIELSY
jgi:hypothetical protein